MVTHQLGAQTTLGKVENAINKANDDTAEGISSHRLTASSHLLTMSSRLAAPDDGTDWAKPSCRSRPQMTAVATVLSDTILSPTLAGDMTHGSENEMMSAKSVEQKIEVLSASSGVRAILCG